MTKGVVPALNGTTTSTGTSSAPTVLRLSYAMLQNHEKGQWIYGFEDGNPHKLFCKPRAERGDLLRKRAGGKTLLRPQRTAAWKC
eukprot:1750221-Rhodomonas_salina.3